ncbi:MAG: methionyl-tRNA formyltransferase [Ardenticatenaceae bacterium]
MRIVFVGTVDFSKHCLQQVLENGGHVVAVLTLPRERARFNNDYADLKPTAISYGVPVYHIDKINDPETITLIRSLQPDVIFVFGLSQLISKEILEIPPLGCIGTHPALLPRNRGRHPLIWALVEGLTESGLTFFYLDEGADSGDILWQKSFPITLEDDAGTLYDKMKILATQAIQDFLHQLGQGTASRIPQKHSQATYWRKRTAKDGEIHWDAPTIQTYNLIRGLTHPYIGAHSYLNGKKIVIWRTQLPSVSLPTEAKKLPPGSIFTQSDSGFNVRTGDGFLTLLEYELMHKGSLKIGMRLGS